MGTLSSIVIRNSAFEPAAQCVVCGNDILAGEGLTARYGERTLRFKCPGCLARFEADPDRYLAADGGGCCGDESAQGAHERRQESSAVADRDEPSRADPSPCSEWALY